MQPPLTGKVLGLHRSRGFRLALLAFQFLWLNIIVPGHQRGVVTMPGTDCAACEAPVEQSAPSTSPEQSSPEHALPIRACCARNSKIPQHVPGDRAGRCAICFFAARVSPPVAFDFTHPPLQFVGMCELPATAVSHSPDFASTYLGRGPPSMA